MFQRKPIYVVLLIVFTLILCAEAALCAFLPDRFSGAGNFKDLDFSNMQMPEGFDPENMGDMQMPEGVDPSNMGDMQMSEGFDPSNMGDMQMPEGFDPSNMGDMQMPEGFDPENMPQGMQRPQDESGNSGGQTQASEQTSGEAESESAGMPQMPSGMEMPTDISAMGRPSGGSFGILYTLKNLWMVIIPVCVLVDAFCIFMLLRISRKRRKEEPQETEEPALQNDKTEKKDIHKKKKRSRIVSLVIVVVFVAVVAILPTMLGKETDKSSAEVKEEVVSATAERGNITTTLLNGGVLTDDTSLSVSVPATVELGEFAVENGDIVKEGDLIAAVEKSSVMIAIAEMQDAIDALDERLEEAAEETVENTLTMPSEGRIKKIYVAENDDVVDAMYEHGALMLISLDGMMAVDIETESLSVGDHVTVVLSDGSEETGRAAKLSENTVTVTISDVAAAFGEKVTVLDENGKQLGTGELYINSELKITGYAGTVSDVYAEEDDNLSAGKKLLSIEEDNYTANYSALYKERTELEERLAKLLKIYREGGIYAEYSGEIAGIVDGEEEESEEETEESFSMQPQQGGMIMTQAKLASAEPPEGTNAEPPAEPDLQPGDNPLTEMPEQNVPQRNGVYPAKISGISYGSIEVMMSAEAAEVSDPSNFTVDEAALTVPTKLEPAAETLVYTYTDGEKQQKTLSDLQAGDLLLCEFDENGVLLSIIYRHTEQQPTQPQQKPSGGMMPNMGGSSMGGTVQQPVEEEYELTETAVCEIIPDEFMTVSISVDELDILSVSLGQKASIRPDSMAGQLFEGEIIEIDRTGTNEGGNTKYTVTIKLARTEAMLSGMNASVSIELEQHPEILTVPAEALYEVGTKTILYTGYDEKEDALINPIEITTGYSDGDLVEVTSGLAEGEEYWYRYADAIEYSFN